MMPDAEELKKKYRSLLKEEEDEERDIQECRMKLAYMRESCMEGDREIRELIEEQEEMLGTGYF